MASPSLPRWVRKGAGAMEHTYACLLLELTKETQTTGKRNKKTFMTANSLFSSQTEDQKPQVSKTADISQTCIRCLMCHPILGDGNSESRSCLCPDLMK